MQGKKAIPIPVIVYINMYSFTKMHLQLLERVLYISVSILLNSQLSLNDFINLYVFNVTSP